MIVIDCKELTADERMALASSISDELAGEALALIRGDDVVFDTVGQGVVKADMVEELVARFASRRKGSEHYSVERDGDRILVHSADPIAAQHGRKHNELPPNLWKCPFCFFVTPYEEVYVVHVRAHGGGIG